MKRFMIPASIPLFMILGVCVYYFGHGREEKAEAAENTVNIAEDASDDSFTIVIPESEEEKALTILSSGDTKYTARSNNGSEYSSADEKEKTVPYCRTLKFTDLSDEAEVSVYNDGMYYAFNVTNAGSVDIDTSKGITVNGDDYKYKLTMVTKKTDKKLQFSGSLTGTVRAEYSGDDISLSSSLVLGKIMVSNENGTQAAYLVNTTACLIHHDGSVSLENGKALEALSDEDMENSGITSVQNVFHTISPALFVSGSVSDAESLINDYVYGNEAKASKLEEDDKVCKSIQYYGETGRLLFTITVYGDGSHARIATADGEVHDYIKEAQEGAHCYPVFSLG